MRCDSFRPCAGWRESRLLQFTLKLGGLKSAGAGQGLLRYLLDETGREGEAGAADGGEDAPDQRPGAGGGAGWSGSVEEADGAGWIEETLNRQLIRRWCRLNYGEKLKPPVLRHRKIAARDLGAWTAALNSLVQGEFLHPGKDDEEYIRDAMELPAAAGQS